MSVVQLSEATFAIDQKVTDQKNSYHKAQSDNPSILTLARKQAEELGLKYAGRVDPEEAWKLFTSGVAHLVDVRSAEERKFVGHVPNTLHVAWQTGPALIKNPRFLRELE